jgi:hypothetical protein
MENPEKTSLIFAFWQPLWVPDGIKYVAKYSSIIRRLKGIIWHAILPYFGKQSDY